MPLWRQYTLGNCSLVVIPAILTNIVTIGGPMFLFSLRILKMFARGLCWTATDTSTCASTTTSREPGLSLSLVSCAVCAAAGKSLKIL